MKQVIVSTSAVVVLITGLTLTGTAYAQKGEADGPHRIGLIDMAHVFKNYTKFEALREDLKAEIAKSDELAKQFAEKIKGLQEQLKTFNEGSPDYAKIEQQFLKATSEFETFRKSKQRDFLREESNIYKTIYLEVTDVVQKYADSYKYTLVIRFNREDPESTGNPQEVMQRMNRQVVYYNPKDDITDTILDYLNRQYERTAGRPATKSSTN